MAWHTAIDIVAGVAAPLYLIHNTGVIDGTVDTQPLERF
jgi:hypothetical protein